MCNIKYRKLKYRKLKYIVICVLLKTIRKYYK